MDHIMEDRVVYTYVPSRSVDVVYVVVCKCMRKLSKRILTGGFSITTVRGTTVMPGTQ